MAIFITGDLHGDIDIGKFKKDAFDHASLTRDDYIIVLGDFGLPWSNPPSKNDNYWLDWIEAKPWTTLFIDGNHENFDALATWPTEPWHGGQVRRIREHVLHLSRAEVFEIGGYTFFTMGGAHSTDKQWRVPFETWWPAEVPDEKVRAIADAKIAEVGQVDFVLTHCPSSEALHQLCASDLIYDLSVDEYNLWLTEHVAERLKLKRWFYGHMHIDRPSFTPFTSLYDYIFDLEAWIEASKESNQ